MLCWYAINDPGPSHVAKDICCQDSYSIARTPEGWFVAAVADGVGSQAHAEIASRTATVIAVDHVVRHLPEKTDLSKFGLDVANIIADAFQAALDEIARVSAEYEGVEEPPDTTLVLAIYDGYNCIWGHAGDSGMVCSHPDGTYECITEQSRDEFGRVWPLCTRDRWVYGITRDVCSLLLATDGILELFAPHILSVHGDQPLDTAMCRQFLHPLEDDQYNLYDISREASEYFAKFPTSLLDDDKTLLVMFNTENMPGEQPESYYAGPDWDAINARAEAALYPNRLPPEET
jgi:hypothetical protein